MAKNLAVVVIHGMGSHTHGYSDELIGELKRRLGDVASNMIRFEEILWADITEEKQAEYISNVGALS